MGGKHRPGTPRDRALGAELRAIRDQVGQTLAEVAAAMRWNVSTLSRLERGQRHIAPDTVASLAAIYGLPAQRRAELVARARQPRPLGWWERPPAGVPSTLCALAAYEYEAARMVDWSPGVIPGLLQTREYALAILRDFGVRDADVNARLGARLQRQELLSRRGVDYTAYIGAAALRNRLGEPDDFVRQLRHLVRMSYRDGVTVRLVSAPTGFALASWYLLHFTRTGAVVHVEHLSSATFLFDHDADPYLAAAEALDSIALTVPATRDTLEELIERHIVGS